MVEQWSSKSYTWVRFLLSLLTRKKNYKYIKRIDYRKIDYRKIDYKKKALVNLFKKNKYLFKNKINHSRNFFKFLHNININDDNNLSFLFKKTSSLSKNFDYKSFSYYSYFVYFNKRFFLDYKNSYFGKLTKIIIRKNNFLFYNRLCTKKIFSTSYRFRKSF